MHNFVFLDVTLIALLIELRWWMMIYYSHEKSISDVMHCFFLMSWELRRSTWISLILWAQKGLQHRMFVTTLAYVADHISWVISNTKHQQPIGLPPSTYGARGLPQLGQRLTFLSYPSVLHRKRVSSFFFHKPQQRSKTNVL